MNVASGVSVDFTTDAYGGGVIGSWMYIYGSGYLAVVPFRIENGDVLVEENQEGFERENAEVVGVSENAHKYGAWIGICGELGADTSLTETFLRMGIDELSVSPGFVLKVREAVRKIDLSEKQMDN